MRMAYCDLEQAESRTVGAIIYRLFGDDAYLNAQECGDPHSLVCSMGWKNLPWPEDFNLTALASTSDRKFPPDLMKAAKTVANREYYRGKSYRDMAKTLAHGSNYFGQPATMASHTHTDVKIISAFQRAYFTAFPFISRWHQWVQYQLETTATITTLLGRRRKFLGRPDDPATLREMIAFEPQSVATGDYMNAGMLAVWNKNLPLWLHKQVHDALAFSYDRRDENWLIPEVCSTLSWPITLTAHPDQLTHLQNLPRRSRREDANLQALSTLPLREFRIPVEAEVGWNLSRRKEWAKDGTRLIPPINPNGLITWKAGAPDTRRRLPTKALTAVERLSLSMGHLNDNKK